MTEEKQHFKVHIERRDKEGGKWETCCWTTRGDEAAKEYVDRFNKVLHERFEYRIRP